jgi:hypothetical protein
MAGPAASLKAARDAFGSLERQALERKRRKLLQVQNWQKLKVNLEGYRNLRGERDIGRAAEALFDTDGLSKYSSVVQREAAVERSATRKLYNVLATFRRNLIGRDQEQGRLEEHDPRGV